MDVFLDVGWGEALELGLELELVRRVGRGGWQLYV